MFEFLKNYNGNIKVNGAELDANSAITLLNNKSGEYTIVLTPVIEEEYDTDNYQITVKPYMTRFETGMQFDFNKQYNNGIPMPLRTMQGNVIKETRNMYYMKLHGSLIPTRYCVKCGRTITDTVSSYYGIGPECAKSLNITRPESDYEYKRYKTDIENKLNNIKWEGWIPKSAIIDVEVLNEEE